MAASSTGIAEVLYDRIRLELERKVGGIKQSLTHSINIRSSEADSTDDAAQLFLITLHDEWNAFARQLSLIRSIFTPLDRTYVLQRKDLLGIWCVDSLFMFRSS